MRRLAPGHAQQLEQVEQQRAAGPGQELQDPQDLVAQVQQAHEEFSASFWSYKLRFRLLRGKYVEPTDMRSMESAPPLMEAETRRYDEIRFGRF